MGAPKLVINHLNKNFNVDGKSVNILNDINLNINEGEFVAIVGHSGCGKSTLLKIIAGLLDYDDGNVTLDSRKITKPDIDRGMVFQEHRLFPWLTIKENLAIGLDKLDNKNKEEIISEHLKLVKLEGFENVYPHQLSGGMSQRAAIARALVNAPKVLLLDEPFGALDALTKIMLQEEILKIWEKEKTTMIMVTHDIEEAVYLADRIVVMSARPGKIKEVVKVDLGRSRDRGSADFARIKKRILSHFFEDKSPTLEYTI
ncbi:ABC transporter ATP-binding protein [Clostridium beijerinckii]|uniref:Sulfonate transport system ATP-binding protein n=1 Tax=Clostridium beijerinckii TaxID=1520 RepID=A0A9Q5CMT2_CLOBE|nr:ABC transporter ATP-binding protein [Clostridium beijerinckii]AQS06015.1 aliphatic sulfonates import ATP-binding protein SsuB [Clostridium beijerinckii]MBA2888380.1 sulfonate transport system ATP-binding protein [Clostridium beijerinckii]MBA2903148.1 sulfonate transport system ATP-binding protein [Clostridium beijerinckii]MBA2912971.1 sulfonate transport system ATP-binding protein [Clostridium beijerinckii]MBA9014380.1 sulfonate transport system ATP-binding protein [Clostridium beijerinckii